MITYRTVKVPHGVGWRWGLIVTYESGAQALCPEPFYETEEAALAEIDRLLQEAAAKLRPE